MLKILKKIPLTIISLTLSVIIPNLVLANPLIAQSSSNFPVVNSAEIRPDINLPWSQVVMIKDPFEGNYLAVLDKNDIQYGDFGSEYKSQVITVWTNPKITVLFSTYRFPEKTIKLSLKLGDQVFNLDGINNTFEINDKLAVALANAPSNENVKIRLILDSGPKIDSAIGQETVKAWKTLYQMQKPSQVP